MRPLVVPIVFCGYGSNLYPLCDAASESSPAKALLPVANRPLLALALQNLVAAGLSRCIVLAPAFQHAAIHKSLANVRLHTPVSRRKDSKAQKMDQGTNIAFSPSSEQHDAAMTIDLLPLGPHDGHSTGKNAPQTATSNSSPFRTARLGTAELVRWIASLGMLEADPLIVPVDLISTSLSLRDLIDVYAGVQASQVGAPTMCCAFYRRSSGDGLGKARLQEGPPRLVTALSEDDEVKRVLFLHDSDMDSDLDIRRSLLRFAPQTRLSTGLLDAHVYILNRQQILPLLENNPRMTSLRDHILPLVAKASWMKGLAQKAGLPLRQQDTHQDQGQDTPMDDSAPVDSSSALQQESIARNAAAQQLANNGVQCYAVVARPPSFVARANTLATYIECNRWLLQAVSTEDTQHAWIPSLVSASGGAAKVAPDAQVAPNSLLGANTTVGERASVRGTTVGHSCEVGRGAKLNGCILLDGSKVLEKYVVDCVCAWPC